MRVVGEAGTAGDASPVIASFNLRLRWTGSQSMAELATFFVQCAGIMIVGFLASLSQTLGGHIAQALTRRRMRRRSKRGRLQRGRRL